MLGVPDFQGGWIGGLPATTWVVTIAWFLLGMVLYFGYGYRHSKLNPNRPEAEIVTPKLDLAGAAN